VLSVCIDECFGADRVLRQLHPHQPIQLRQSGQSRGSFGIMNEYVSANGPEG
jgi:hypothetical protein